MCDVCCASAALQPGGAIFQWEKNGPWVRMEAKGKGPECEPCEYRIRKKGGRWSRWAKTPDLAGVTGRLCVDVKWDYTGPTVRGYLSGELSAEQVLNIIGTSQRQITMDLAAEATVYTEFMADGSIILSSDGSRRFPPQRVLLTKQASDDAVCRTVRMLCGLPEEGLA